MRMNVDLEDQDWNVVVNSLALLSGLTGGLVQKIQQQCQAQAPQPAQAPTTRPAGNGADPEQTRPA